MTVKGVLLCIVFLLPGFISGCLAFLEGENDIDGEPDLGEGKILELPEPARDSVKSLEEVINKRQSRREFRDRAVEYDELAQIMWAAAGDAVDASTGATRVAPSAGATHPMEIYLVAGRVEGAGKGVYHYRRDDHRLQRVKEGDYRESLAGAALGQEAVAQAPASVVVVGYYGRTTGRYGERGKRYVHMEAGHIAQNISLQVKSLGLSTVVIGAFDDGEVAEILGEEASPLVIMPVGRSK